ncbi:hemagglutinin repeat-containing protein [Malaciobacter mytili]|uniref:two-partner secretion domain-containing protein n=1 Tax=Malaciobacter mytili TaxID=603050 RepID=UPI003A8B6600
MKLEKNISILLSMLLILNTALYSKPVIVDPNATLKNKATLDKSQNGLDIVNIVNPDSKGVSHNKFQNYNVQKKGLILNNSLNIVKTQLAGYISHNPNLKNNAKLILNEITSTNRTNIEGYTEVGGKKADVIVANPNGITVNGGGFINTNKAVLTTGVPTLKDGYFNGFNIEKGAIFIEGEGFNTSNISRVELYSKLLNINAKFYANNLKVITGENQVFLDGTTISKERLGSGVSIDSSLLGGIYANKVELISNDKGVGVNLPAEVFAQDSFTLDANGNISVKKLEANNTHLVSSENITFEDKVYSKDIKVEAKDTILLKEDDKVSITAENKIELLSKNLSNNAYIYSGYDKDLNSVNINSLNNINVENITNNGLISAYNLNIEAKNIINSGALYSKDNMNINSEVLNNMQTIYSNKDINFYIKNTLENNGIIMSDRNLTFAANNNTEKTNTINNNNLIQAKNDINIYAKTLNNKANEPTVRTTTTSSTQKVGSGKNYDLVTTTINEQIVDINSLNPSKILADGNITLDVGTLNNFYSLIASNKDLVLNAQEANNVGKVIVKTTTTTTKIYRKKKECSGHGPFKECKYKAKYRGTTIDVKTNKVPIVNFGIQAKDSISGNIENLNNLNNEKISSLNGLYKTNSTTFINDNIESLSSNPTKFNQSIFVPQSKFGIFIKSTPNTNYLIETNPLFTNYGTFVSSDYMIGKLNINIDDISKRLGDAMYETAFVRDMIIKSTGKRYLAGFDSDLEQYKALMDNAISIKEDLNLNFGVTLTKEQLLKLTKNIIWMEEEDIEGEKVLVPKLYLASNNIEKDGSQILAKNINLNIKNDLINEGKIKTEENLIVDSKNIINKNATLEANKNIILKAKENIENLSGLIKSQEKISLEAGKNINNITLSNQETKKHSKGKETYTIRGASSKIEAKEDINLKAENINLKKAEINSLSDVNLEAKNINLESLQMKNSYAYKSSSGHFRGQNLKNAKSNISAKNVTINTDNLNIKASDINALNNILIDSKNNINILANNDLEYQDIKTKTKSFLSKKTKRDIIYKESVVSSNLTANNIYLNSQKDITLEATKLKAKENIVANAEGNVNVVAKQYKEVEIHQKSKSSWGGLKKSISLDKLDNLNLKEAKLQTEALNIILKSGKDINIIASQINSAADVQLEAFNKLFIAAGEEQKQKQHISKKTSFNPLGISNMMGIDMGSIYSKELNKNKNYSTKIKQTNITAGNDFTANTGSTQIIGSNIEANKNINITSDINSIEIVSAKEINNVSSLNKKVEVKLNSMQDMLKSSIEEDINKAKNSTDKESNSDTKIKINVAKATYDKDEVNSKSTKNISSNLVSKNGNININSGEDVLVQGSNLTAKEDINLTAQIGNVTIKEAVDTKSVDEKSKHASAEVNVTVQNEYVEIVSVIKDAILAAKQLKKVKKEYSNYKKQVKKLEKTLRGLKKDLKAKKVGVDFQDVEDVQEIVDNAKDDERYYLAAVAAATADLASKTVAIAQQAAIAASSSGTWGFSAGLSLDLQGSKTTSNKEETKSIASNLNANNITIKTNKNIDTNVNISGSNIIGQDKVNIETKDLAVKASVDTTNSKSDTKELSGSVSMTMYGAAGGPRVSLGYGEQHYDSDSAVYNNSQIKANKININVANDTDFDGANVNANNTLNLNVGNDLNIQSKRNSNNSNSNGFKLSAGFGTNNGSITSVNGSYGANTGRTKVKQTVLTSVTGDKVNVNVGNNTNLKGSLLASGKFDENGNFIDNENLDFTTKTLTFSNSTDSVYNTNSSFNVGTNIGLSSSAKDSRPKDNASTKINSTSLAFSNSMGYQRAKTLATLGQGNITIQDKENSDDTTSLNRDTKNISKTMINTNYGVEVDATLDHRLLSKEGISQIKDDFNTASAITNAIGQIISTKKAGVQDFFNETQKNVKVYNAMKEKIANDEKLSKDLQNPNLEPNAKQNMLNEVALGVMKELGYISNDVRLVYTDEKGANDTLVKGHYNPNTQTSYINDKYNNSTKELVSSLGHEITHDMDNQDGKFKANDKDQNKYATNFGDDLAFYTQGALNIVKGGSLANINNHNKGTTTSILNSNNHNFDNLDKSVGDDRVTVYSRPVLETSINHLFAVVDKRENGKPDIIFSLGDNNQFDNIFEQGIPIVEVLEVNKVESEAKYTTIKDDKQYLKNNTYVDKQIIKVPKGMTQNQFDELVLKNAQLYDVNKNPYPNFVQTIGATVKTMIYKENNPTSPNTNSNTFIDNVIEKSGGNIKTFDNAPLQNAKEDTQINNTNKGNK